MKHIKKENFKQSIYDNGYYIKRNLDWHMSDSPWKANYIEKIIRKNNLVFQSICDLGCGAGHVLKQLSIKNNFEQVKLFGYEMSNDAFNLCKKIENKNISFFKENLIDIDIKFDILLCIDVFEHIENYIEFISSIKNKADYKIFHIPLDISILSIINGSLMHARETVGHLHYFTPDTALATLKDCNYEIIDIMFTPSFTSPGNKSFKTKLVNILRKIFYSISPKFTSTFFGGVSLMVLAK